MKLSKRAFAVNALQSGKFYNKLETKFYSNERGVPLAHADRPSLPLSELVALAIRLSLQESSGVECQSVSSRNPV